MIHSVGVPQPEAAVFARSFNVARPNGQQVAVHAFLQADGAVYQTLPWNYRGWHCGSGSRGSGNNTHIGVELTEPSTIRYTGGANWVENADGVNTRNFVQGTYRVAVELCAHLCRQFDLDPLADGVIISHSEGFRRGIASNHGDVEHIWHRLGLTMAQFRQDIYQRVSAPDSAVDVAGAGTETGDVGTGSSSGSVPRPGSDLNTGTAATVASASGTTSKPVSNPPPIPATLSASTTLSTGFTPYLVKVTAKTLNIRQGPGISFPVTGQITSQGTFTIVDEALGSGSTKWGKLKSGAGWISLDFTEKRDMFR